MRVAEEFFEIGTPIGVASGLDFPDAMVGGADTPSRGGPLLLTRADRLPVETAWFLRSWDPDTVVIYGGLAAIGGALDDVLASR